METAVVIALPGLSPVVDHWREQTCDEDRPSMGIPPHVTLLHPFVPAEDVEASLDELRALFAATPYFTVSFREVRRWPGMVYLAPEPPESFSQLTDAITEHWPDHPPYEGVHETVIPHLTVAYGDDALLADVEADVAPHLPCRFPVVEAVLLEEVEPHRRWDVRARFPLRSEPR